MSVWLESLRETLSNRYRIERQIGAGGMSAIYLARDLKHDRMVAIKVLPADLAASGAERFLREIAIVSRLQHPHILPLHDSGVASGISYYVMPFVEGESLGDRLAREKQLPVEDALRITREVAKALAYAHAQGVIHRDIKPDNILLSSDHAVVADFGIARAIEVAGGEALTRTGDIVGTPLYFSPEQAFGGQVDERSDLYSLGCVLFEMLAGRPPFTGETVDSVVRQHMAADPPPITVFRPAIPRSIESILRRALAKSPVDRFPSASALVRALDAVRVDSEEPQELPDTGKARRFPRVVPWLVASIAIAVLLGAAILGGRLRPGRSEPAGIAAALAVEDFQQVGGNADPTLTVSATSLIYTGLVEASPCRVVSPELLYDVRRRKFGSARESIPEEQALAVAREAGATLLLAGQVVRSGNTMSLLWRLVDVRTGASLAGRRVDAANLVAAADLVLSNVVPHLPASGTARSSSAQASVGELTSTSPEAFRRYVAGTIASSEGRGGDALREFRVAVELDSTFALAYFALAQALPPTAESESRALAARAWRLRSRLGILDRLKLEAWQTEAHYQYSDAERIYEEILQRWPDDRDALKAIFNLGTMSDCLTMAERGRRLYPDDASFGLSIVSSLDGLDRSGEALASARDLAARFPRNPEVWCALGNQYLVEANPDSAEAAFRSALAADPGSALAKTALAQTTYARGDVDGAVRSLEQLHDDPSLSPPERYALYFGGGLTYCWFGPSELLAEQGRFRAAVAILDRARRESPDVIWERRSVQYQVYQSYLCKLGPASFVMDHWRSWTVRRDLPEHERWEVQAWHCMGLILADSLPAAERELVDLTRQADQRKLWHRVRCVLMRADLDLRHDQPERALAALTAIQTLGIPARGQWGEFYYRLLARAKQMAGKPGEAVRILQRCARIYPGHALAHYELGNVYRGMQRPDEAAAEYRLFLRAWAHADPGLPQIADARRQLEALTRRGT